MAAGGRPKEAGALPPVVITSTLKIILKYLRGCYSCDEFGQAPSPKTQSSSPDSPVCPLMNDE